MDIIVRTSHGAADVSVEVNDESARLSDLVELIIGRPAPAVVLLDGHPVAANRPVVALPAGSIIDVDVPSAPADSAAPARLLQLTGPGAGTSRPLSVGTYRLGSGTRVNVAELASGRVRRPAIEVRVSPDSTVVAPAPRSDVTVTTTRGTLDADMTWTSELVNVDGRTFAHERGREPLTAQLPVDAQGRTTFRGHASSSDVRRLLLIDAQRDAEQLRAHLWGQRQRLGDPYRVLVGLHHETLQAVPIEISEPVVLAGDPDVTAAHARALLIDAVTTYGPADLDVVVAAERLHHWDWTKWLPHIDDPAAPSGTALRLFGSDDADRLRAWSRRLATGACSRPTLVVVAGDVFWSGPGSPLHRLVVDGVPNVSVIALTDGVDVPPRWATLIGHADAAAPGRALLSYRRGGATDILTALPSPATAVDVARRLARLVDPERPVTPAEDAANPRPHTIAELVSGGHAGAVPAVRWHTRVGTTSPASLPIALTPAAPVEVDLGLGLGVAVSGSSLDAAAHVLRTIVASMATTWSPHELAIVTVDHRADADAEPLRALPHAGGTFSERGTRAGRRLTSRLATELLAPTPSARRLAVVVTDLASTEAAAPGFVRGLTRLASAARGIHLLVATTWPLALLDDEMRSLCAIQISTDRVADRRRATVVDGRLRTPFAPFRPPPPAADPLVVTPNVFGRPLTAMERRIVRATPHDDERARSDAEFATLARQLAAVAELAGLGELPPLVPQPLPDRVPAGPLSAAHPNAVPLGIVARSDLDDPEPYVWRATTGGSLLVVGSAASGVHALCDVLLLGIAQRFAPDHLEVFLIDPDDDRRRAADALAVVRRVAAPGDADDVEAILGPVSAELRNRAVPRDVPAQVAPILLVVRDLDQLSAKHRRRVGELSASGTPHGISVVAASTAPVTDIVSSTVPFAVGELDDPAGYAALGIADHSDLAGRPGRCLLGRDQLLLQVAEPEQPLAEALAELDATTVAPAAPAATAEIVTAGAVPGGGPGEGARS